MTPLPDSPAAAARARQYLHRIPPAVAGCGGDVATYRAAVALVRGFQLSPDTALPLLQEWNTLCSPPWNDRALRTKLASAARSTKPGGYLLNHEPPPRLEARRATPPAQKNPRLRWPAFSVPSPEDRAAIAALRGVSVKAVEVLCRARYLWRCRWKQEECWAIHHEKFAQVRRMDGQPFPRVDDDPVKALSLPGSEGAFLHPGLAADHGGDVIFTEGAASLLEAVEIVLRAAAVTGRLRPMVLFAAVSAGSRLNEEHLKMLAGRRVLLLPDADRAGLLGAARWQASLRDAGCTVFCRQMPAGCKDTGDALRRFPPGDPCWAELVSLESPS